MDQKEIIERYQRQVGADSFAAMYRLFCEGMQFMAPTYMTFVNWCKGDTVPLENTLKFAQVVYSPDDWRYQMASELLAVQVAQ